jgi:hypothetical protein
MQEGIRKLELAYLEIAEPENLVRNMSYDEFVDWAELGTKEDIECAIKEFNKVGLKDHVRVMEIIIDKKTYQKN